MAEKVEESSPPQKGRLGRKWLILGIAGIVLIGGGGTFVVIKYLRKAGTAAAAEKPKKEVVESALNLDPFLVNLADRDAVRFVKVTFRLGLSENEKAVAEGLAKNNVFLAATRDSIISILTSKTSDEILTPEGKEKLRQEVQSRINPLLPKGKVLEVYIVDFVVQL